MNNSTETSPLDYQWSPWKRVEGKLVKRGLPMPCKTVYVQEDWLDPEVPVEWLAEFLSLIKLTKITTVIAVQEEVIS